MWTGFQTHIQQIFAVPDPGLQPRAACGVGGGSISPTSCGKTPLLPLTSQAGTWQTCLFIPQLVCICLPDQPTAREMTAMTS